MSDSTMLRLLLIFVSLLITLEAATIYRFYEQNSTDGIPTCTRQTVLMENSGWKSWFGHSNADTIKEATAEVANDSLDLIKTNHKTIMKQLDEVKELLTAKPASNCPMMTHHFPRESQTADYVRYGNRVPSMKAGTVCGWFETTKYKTTCALGYASGNADALSIFFTTNPSRLIFHVYGSDNDFDTSSLSSMSKFHLCVTFSSKLNQRSVYINGDEVETLSHTTSPTKGGGLLVLGQDHDKSGGWDFESHQSFTGNITNFMIWPRVLTGQEISDIARNCDCPSDFAIAMTLDRVENSGETYYSIPVECPVV